MIFSDKKRLMSDVSVKELHDKAAKLNIPRKFFCPNRKEDKPHYQIPPMFRILLNADGVEFISQEDFDNKLLELYNSSRTKYKVMYKICDDATGKVTDITEEIMCKNAGEAKLYISSKKTVGISKFQNLTYGWTKIYRKRI